MERGTGQQSGGPMPHQQGSRMGQEGGMAQQGGMGQQGEMTRRGSMGQQEGGQQGSMGKQGGMGQQTMTPTQRGPSHAQVRSAAPRLEPLEVEEVARSEVVTAEPGDTVAEVVSKMADEDVGSVVVVEDDQPTGIVTDRKIALALGEATDVTDMTAGEIATEDIAIGRTDMTVFDAAELLRDEGIRRLPLVDEDGQLEGIVTLDDILVLLASKFGVAAEVIEMQAPGR